MSPIDKIARGRKERAAFFQSKEDSKEEEVSDL